MQKQNIIIKNKYVRSHHVRISAIALAMATAFHIAGVGHIGQEAEKRRVPVTISQVFASHMERENETARHPVRFDEGLRLPFTSGQ